MRATTGSRAKTSQDDFASRGRLELFGTALGAAVQPLEQLAGGLAAGIAVPFEEQHKAVKDIALAARDGIAVDWSAVPKGWEGGPWPNPSIGCRTWQGGSESARYGSPSWSSLRHLMVCGSR
jgi:hypothetical protein